MLTGLKDGKSRASLEELCRKFQIAKQGSIWAISSVPRDVKSSLAGEASHVLEVVGVCRGGAGELEEYDPGTLGLPVGAKRRAIAMAVLLSLTFVRMPGSTLR